MGDEEFEAAVGDGLDRIPEELAAAMSNVVVLVADEPDEEQLAEARAAGDLDTGDPAATLLGLYEGTPLTERDGWWDAGSLPDRITVFKGPLLRLCDDVEDLVEEVAVTVVHEVAHHFGIDDERLHELGWG
ncbi:metallopeptidase family protein [Pseudokineococcus marinus]|uniref:Metallopeptidase family protein n=1 Tax=Pseudokineococcus marinus TaxID=351215 RepID=A0A849BYN6_9ACTN|nr:metallopeptidase family protein [Pseudokineococcus marinus]NNH24526.1 metallopeptidase family protein [Pseudokineococcus marinus]